MQYPQDVYQTVMAGQHLPMDVYETRRERLRSLITDRFEGIQARLAAAIDRQADYVSRCLRGTKRIGEEFARHIEKTLGLPDLWLDGSVTSDLQLGYDIEGKPPGRRDAVTIPGERSNNQDRGMDVTIPQFDTGGAMGDGLILRDQPGVIQAWRVSPEWLQKNVKNATSAQNLCIVTGFGDSMRPLFNPGDPLIVDRGVNRVDFDAIYFFRVGEEGFIKRLQRVPGQGLVALSENKSYKEWVVTPDMDFEVFGRVLKIWRGEDF